MTTATAIPRGHATALLPYEAWFFFAADNRSEVDEEFTKIRDSWQNFGEYGYPQMADLVQVVAAAHADGTEQIYFVRDGVLESRESWLVRKVPW